MPLNFSLKEAAAIAGVPEPAVRKAIEAGTVRPRAVSVGRARRYRFGVGDMLYLKLVAGFPLALSGEDKAALRCLIEHREPPTGRWQAGEEGDLVVRAGEVAVRVEAGPVETRSRP